MEWLATLDPRIWQAVIAGLFLGAGWFVNGLLNRREAAALRREKLRDMHRALYAEIGNNLANLWDDERIESYAEGIVERMQGDPQFVPLIPREHNDTVFDVLLPDIHVLPRQTIDPIVAYYSQLKSIAALVDDMRGESFKSMAQTRRIAMYHDYIEMKKQALSFGRYANAVIDAFGKGGREAAERVRLEFNTPAEAPSGPLPGSE
ncbi:hypothetical protein [Oceanicola sp. 502str15]|uniref:hypothetical protein n=1 Tax=Oceanicola sp. 502str15 TaxID=2696061 RepID=UPI0020961A4D|nr:hypothetical protein [Oceanicola sp. 502str15]MCO6381247.1 hypothetical protein [Oceanicola sp. 502str15]